MQHLIKIYFSRKLCFYSAKTQCVEILSSFTCSYKNDYITLDSKNECDIKSENSTRNRYKSNSALIDCEILQEIIMKKNYLILFHFINFHYFFYYY